MRILMIAPQAFFRPSGTPFSIYNRTTILSELGHEVDIVCYPFGEDIAIKNCAIIRSPCFPFVRSIRPGPSLKKLLLDIPFFFTVRRVAKKKRYDAVISHEEGAVMGRWVRRRQGIPHVYDMHSFFPIMFEEWGVSRWKLFHHLGNVFQRFLLRGSDMVIVNCLNLKEAVTPMLRAMKSDAPVIVIENTAAMRGQDQVKAQDRARLKRQLGLEDEAVILYTGSFVPLQNLDLLLESIPHVQKKLRKEFPKTRWVLVGGEPDEIGHLKKKAEALGVLDALILRERVPPQDMSTYLSLATIVASPRVRGINVPFKLFSLMESGKPILASRSRLYRSFLDDRNAMLADAAPEDFAKATVRLLKDKALRQRLVKAALEKAKQEYGAESYKRKMRDACRMAAKIGERMRR